tara:strand:- start:1399 stop:2952 length:1554 start_codon:yes stop_codon:yes gene_type:complete
MTKYRDWKKVWAEAPELSAAAAAAALEYLKQHERDNSLEKFLDLVKNEKEKKIEEEEQEERERQAAKEQVLAMSPELVELAKKVGDPTTKSKAEWNAIMENMTDEEKALFMNYALQVADTQKASPEHAAAAQRYREREEQIAELKAKLKADAGQGGGADDAEVNIDIEIEYLSDSDPQKMPPVLSDMPDLKFVPVDVKFTHMEDIEDEVKAAITKKKEEMEQAASEKPAAEKLAAEKLAAEKLAAEEEEKTKQLEKDAKEKKQKAEEQNNEKARLEAQNAATALEEQKALSEKAKADAEKAKADADMAKIKKEKAMKKADDKAKKAEASEAKKLANKWKAEKDGTPSEKFKNDIEEKLDMLSSCGINMTEDPKLDSQLSLLKETADENQPYEYRTMMETIQNYLTDEKGISPEVFNGHIRLWDEDGEPGGPLTENYYKIHEEKIKGLVNPDPEAADSDQDQDSVPEQKSDPDSVPEQKSDSDSKSDSDPKSDSVPKQDSDPPSAAEPNKPKKVADAL